MEFNRKNNFKKIEILSSNQLLIFLGGIFVVLNKSMHGFTVAPSFGVTTIRSDLFDGEERQFFNISKVLFELTKDA